MESELATRSPMGIAPAPQRVIFRRWSAPAVGDDGAVALLFTDIEGSTALLERVGDRAWVQVLRRHHAMVRGFVGLHGGVVVHVAGDGFMIAFADACEALGCAVAIQRRLAAAPDPALGTPLRVRMGVHTGRVLRDEADLHGRTVVVAARIAARARGGEILVSDAVASCEPVPDRVRFARVGAVALKGLNGRETLYSVDWGAGAALSGRRPGSDPGLAPIRRGGSLARALVRLTGARAVRRARRVTAFDARPCVLR